MRCCRPETSSPPRAGHREEVILRVTGASVHLMEEDGAVDLARGDLIVLRVFDGAVLLAVIVRINADIQWPLTRDEPVVKLDELHYLFSLPEKGGGFLNYGVSFSGAGDRLKPLDSFLEENACFSVSPDLLLPPGEDYWSSLKVDDYNGLLAKTIAAGTGQIVKGIFKCSDVYANQVQRGAKLIQSRSRSGVTSGGTTRTTADRKHSSVNRSIRSVRRLSEMTEKMSRSLLDGVLSVTGSLATPVFRSRAGKSALATVPGEALLATLDAVNKVLDAVEAAERKTIAATGRTVAGVVSQRFGENAGEATEDVFATVGHAVGTAWNIFKIRQAIGPSSSTSSSILKSAVRRKRSSR